MINFSKKIFSLIFFFSHYLQFKYKYSPSTDFHTEHSTSLWKTFNGVHNKFGLWLPSFSIPKN